MEINKIKPYGGTQERLMQSDADIIIAVPSFHQYSSENSPVFITADFGNGDDLTAITEFRINKGKLPEVIKTYTKDNIDYLKR